jgi:hypothetical protein
VKGKFAKCEDILRKFARDVRQRQRNELRSLLGKGSVKEENKGDVQESKKPVMANYVNLMSSAV